VFPPVLAVVHAFLLKSWKEGAKTEHSMNKDGRT